MFSANQLVKYKRIIESTYTGTCIITEHQKVQKQNCSTGFSDVIIHQDIPCRLSFSTVNSVSKSDSTSVLVQNAKLFLSPDIIVKPGSKITVTQDGRTTDYTNSGVPAVYSTHQEISLEVFDKWA